MPKKYRYMLFIFLLFIISTHICSVKYSDDLDVKYVYNSSELRCKYTISNIKEKTDKYEVLVYYPITEYNKINEKILQNINNEIDKFKQNIFDNNNKLNITFDSFEKDIYTSFVFNLEIKNNNAHKTVHTFCYNIDNENKRIYTIDDYLKQDNNIKSLTENIYTKLKENKNIQEKYDYNTIKEYLNEDKEKYSNFYFSNEGMVFCFNPGTVINKSIGVIKVTIPYK